MGLWVIPRVRKTKLHRLFFRQVVSHCCFFPTPSHKRTERRIGINWDSTFEAEILERTRHCQIWGYDFSVKAFGPQIPEKHLSRTHFFPHGLAGVNQHGPDDSPKMYTLDTLMRMNGP